MIADLLRLAFKDLRSGGFRALLVVLSVAVGSATLIAFVSQAEGMKRNIELQFQALSPNLVVARAFSPTFVGEKTLVLVASLPHVVKVKGGIIIPASLTVNGKPLHVDVIGLDAETFSLAFPQARLASGEALLDVPGTALVGNDLYKAGLSPGVTFSVKPDWWKVELYATVTGALEKMGVVPAATGFNPDKAIYVNKYEIMSGLGIRGYNAIYAFADDPKNVMKVYYAMKKLLGDKFVVFAPAGIMRLYLSMANFAARFLLAISAMAFLASGFGIANTLMITVIERTKEIAIMKAVGYTSRQILAYYLALSLLFGAVGGLLGIALGYALSGIVSKYVNIISQGLKKQLEQATGGQSLVAKMQARTYVTPQLIAMAVGFSLLTAVLAGLYPAYRAARLDPIEALRGE